MASTIDDINLQDPIQGHDVRVKTYATGSSTDTTDPNTDTKPLDNFTDIMMKVVSQTETYLPLFSKTPRYLDGEIIIVWSATAGALSFNFVHQTFGKRFADALAKGRRERVRRTNRFKIEFAVDPMESGSNPSVYQHNTSLTGQANKMTLLDAVIDRRNRSTHGSPKRIHPGPAKRIQVGSAKRIHLTSS